MLAGHGIVCMTSPTVRQKGRLHNGDDYSFTVFFVLWRLSGTCYIKIISPPCRKQAFMPHSNSSSTLVEDDADALTDRRQILTVYGPLPRPRLNEGKTFFDGTHARGIKQVVSRTVKSLRLKRHQTTTCPWHDLPEDGMWWFQPDHVVVPSRPCSKHERQLWIATELKSNMALISSFVDVTERHKDIFLPYKVTDGSGPIPRALACLRNLKTLENLANTEGNKRRWEWRYCVAVAVCLSNKSQFGIIALILLLDRCLMPWKCSTVVSFVMVTYLWTIFRSNGLPQSR